MNVVRDIGKVGILALALTAGTAFASQEYNAEVSVSFAELDLTKSAGAEALYARLQDAAEEVCGVNERTFSGFYQAGTAEKRACYEDALDRAVAQIDAPLLKEKHPG